MSAKDRPPEPWASFLAALDAAVGTAVEIHCLGGFMVEHAYRIQRDTPTEDLLHIGHRHCAFCTNQP